MTTNNPANPHYIQVPIDTQGHVMEQAGRGNYPYDCAAKDKWPNDMVFTCSICHSWNHEHGQSLWHGIVKQKEITIPPVANPHYIRTIPDATWEKLKRRAKSLDLTIGKYIAVLVEEDS